MKYFFFTFREGCFRQPITGTNWAVYNERAFVTMYTGCRQKGDFCQKVRK